jgi:hypothetical protein
MKTAIINSTIFSAFFIVVIFLTSFKIKDSHFLYHYNTEVSVDTIVPGRMLSFKDSVYLGVLGEKKVYLIHRLKPKQNLKGLEKYYAISAGDITFINPSIKNMNVIPVGHPIKIPIPVKAIMMEDNETTQVRWKVVPLLYKVKKGDTVFRIAKKYFDMPIETLMKRNNLEDYNLELGQVLHIGWMDVKGIKASQRTYTGLNAELRSINRKLKKRFIADAQSKTKKLAKKRGIAKWNKNSSRDVKLYALHRTAPIGTVIKVYAPAAKRTLYVKVMGKMSKNVFLPDEILYLSPSAAKALGGINERLRVDLTYYQ